MKAFHAKASALLAGFLLGGTGYRYAHGQMSEKTLDPAVPTQIVFHVNSGSSSPPIKVVRIMVGNIEVPLDAPVALSGMWMRDIRVFIQNLAPKTIVQGGIILMFPEIKANGSPVPGIPISLGRFPERAFMKRDGTTQRLNNPPPPEVQILPGSTAEFKSYETADAVQSKAYSLADHLSKVNIALGTIYFGDGTKWVAGRYFEAAPPPLIWQEITPEQFFSSSPLPPK